MDEEYCVVCGQEIKQGFMGYGGMKFVRMKNGIHCERCAKIVVEKNRKRAGK